jgi:DNA modification methylase
MGKLQAPILADRIERWPVERLKPYDKNPRTHSAEQLAQLKRSIAEFGFTNPILVDGKDGILAGHGRLMAAKDMGLAEVPVLVLDHLTPEQRRAYVIADNQLALNAGWDMELLQQEVVSLNLQDFDLDLLGFDDEFLEGLLNPDGIDLGGSDGGTEGLTDPDEVPEPPAEPVTKPGDVWLLGKHRVMCGDSTVITDVERLMAGERAALLHADPPYGMGKASDGVANDNLYNDDLDAFQMKWWATFRPFLLDNASAYIWGNAPELWRLWWKAGLGSSEKMELRNQIVWDKKAIPGMASADLNQYPVASEHCLFFQLGNQLIGNMNTADYWDGWEPLRCYLEQETKSIGWKVADLNRATDTFMGGHWVTKSQWAFPTADQYKKIQAAAAGQAFKREYEQLKREYEQLKREYDQLKRETRSYFDNAHDVMRDVWEFSRVTGEERHGHATPKPVSMMERVMLSSLPKGGLCVEPFGGSGSTLMGAERTGRRCNAMELNPVYCDVIVKRWQDFTGKTATLEATGELFQAEQ